MNADIFGILFGMVFILITAAVVVFFGYVRMKRHEMLHEERKMAIDKGLVLPEEPNLVKNPEIAHKNAALQNRKAFVILFFLGLAFAIFMPPEDDFSGKLFGGVMIFLSFAFLIMSTFKYKLSDEEKEYYAEIKKNREEHHSQDYGVRITAGDEISKKDSEPV
jgi:hypothetical protein